MELQLNIAEQLSKQSVYTKVGLALLLLSFVFQMVNEFWTSKAVNFKQNWNGIWIALGMWLIIFACSNHYAHTISKRTELKVKEILKTEKNK